MRCCVSLRISSQNQVLFQCAEISVLCWYSCPITILRILHLVLSSLLQTSCETCSVPSCLKCTWFDTIQSPPPLYTHTHRVGDATSSQSFCEPSLWPWFRVQSLTALSLPICLFLDLEFNNATVPVFASSCLYFSGVWRYLLCIVCRYDF